MRSCFMVLASILGSSCSSHSTRVPLAISDVQGWAPGCYKGFGSILTPGSSDSAESVWLVLRKSRSKERFTHPWFAAQFVSSDTTFGQQPARWTSFGGDTLEVTWHNGFSGVYLKLVRDASGLRGDGQLTTDQLVQTGPNSFSVSSDKWIVSFSGVSCSTVPNV
jgi:hypothetical protein